MKSLSILLLLICVIMGGIQAQETDPQQEEILPPRHEANPQEGRKKLTELELPQVVRQAFSESEYQGMAIIGVYELSDGALNELIDATRGPKPDRLYEIHVANDTHVAFIYFTRDGTLYEVTKKV
jgi:hypothetical protein